VLLVLIGMSPFLYYWVELIVVDRYIALQNDQMDEGPLQKYFLGEKMHGAGADIFTANMYLAEDRVRNPFLSFYLLVDMPD
jgi:hypothetical protein